MSDPTLGELVKRATQDLSVLVHQEITLAKVEITGELMGVARGAGLLGGAGAAGLLSVAFLSAGAAFGIGETLGTWAGFLIVGAVYLVAAALLAVKGRAGLSAVGPPDLTLGTVKDDLAWAKHPTRPVEQTVP